MPHSDARGVVKTLSYDGINRLGGVQYSDGTANQSYEYDNTAANPYALDRLTKITEGANSQAFTYDNWGQITKVSHVIDGNTYLVQYGYNGAGQIASITYPTGRLVMQNYDAIGRLASICDGSGSNCTGTTYLSGIAYNAGFQPTAVTYGNSDQGAFGYNDHLQIATLRYTHPGNATDILNLAYDYGQSYNGNTVNNGQIQKIRYYTTPGAEDTTKSEYFTYDQYGRLSAAQTATFSSSTPGTWSLNWGYDRFGNRLTQTLVGGNTTRTDIGQAQLTVDPATNRITNTGFNYDAAGNLTADGTHTYSYDALNRMKQVDSGAVTSTYFGPLRIKKVASSTTTVYVYSGTRPIVEYVNGSPSKEYIYSGSQVLAEITSGSVTYHHPDHLSNRADTDAAGNVTRRGHAPFGESWYDSGSSKLKFTTYERDGESKLDYAQFRYYSSGFGRFMSTDLLGGGLDEPQSLNRYVYALNDPLNMIDPQGLNPNYPCNDYWCEWPSNFSSSPPCFNEECWYDGPGVDGGGHPEHPPLDGGMGSGGGGSTGSGTPAIKVNLDKLFKCILDQFGVIGKSFSIVTKDNAGVFNGTKQSDSSVVSLSSDGTSFSTEDLSRISNINGGPAKVTGLTLDGYTATRSVFGIKTLGGIFSYKTSYVGNDLAPGVMVANQIHELGHQLAKATGENNYGGGKYDYSNEKYATNLEDCYAKTHK
ncbi:MAG: hypothetical protein DMG65_10115 [Candidatus Angelobacter sp. Gp1-AA117]|nr:MAG: hypothetical protein DMG65_10115 [Candidatus Angelobacter sp. Gp1-AA117]